MGKTMSYAYIEFSAPIDDYYEIESWAVSNTHTTPAYGGSSGGSRGPGRALVNDFTFTTADQILQNKMFQAVSHGTVFKQAYVYLYTDKGDLYLYYTFTDVVVGSAQISGSKGSVSLNIASFSYEYFET
jgi:type VI protein secretion system component Hcp